MPHSSLNWILKCLSEMLFLKCSISCQVGCNISFFMNCFPAFFFFLFSQNSYSVFLLQINSSQFVSEWRESLSCPATIIAYCIKFFNNTVSVETFTKCQGLLWWKTYGFFPPNGDFSLVQLRTVWAFRLKITWSVQRVTLSFRFLPKLIRVVGYGKSRDMILDFLQEWVQNGCGSGTTSCFKSTMMDAWEV